MHISVGRAIAVLRRLGEQDGVIAGVVAGVSFAFYLPTLSPSVVAGDGGELQMLSRVLGISHPTGYPLFMLLAWLFGHLPLGGDWAYRITLFGTLATATAAGMTYLTARELGAGKVPAFIGALLAAAAPQVWSHAAAAEVYPLSDLFLVGGWWLLIRWGKRQIPLWAVALAFGFGLAHHISLRLLGPAVLIYLLLVEPRLPLRPRQWGPALVALLLPLLLYAYVPLRAAQLEARPELAGQILGIRKTVASGLISPHYYAAGPLGLALALDYSQQFLGQGDMNWSGAFSQYFEMTRQQFPLLVVPVALVGLVVLFRRRSREALLFLLSYGFVMLAAISFLARVGEDGDHFLPTYFMVAIWFAVGVEALLVGLGQGLRRWPRVRTVVAGGLCLLPALSLAVHYPGAMAARQVDLGRALLIQPLPQGAVLAGEWSVVTPLRYYQRVEGIRPDLWIMPTDTAGISVLMQRALADRVPFYALRWTATGVRLLPLPAVDAGSPTHPADVPVEPSVHWRGYDLEPTDPAPGDELWITLYWQVLAPVDRDWTTFIHLLDDRGEKVAQVDRSPVDGFYPTPAWQPGLLLADQYELRLRPDLPPGHYRLIFGWYAGGDRLAWDDGQDTHLLAEIVVRPG